MGLDVAVTLVIDPRQSWGVNELARHLRRSPGRTSEVLGSLRDEGLVTPGLSPVVPELFWATADQWHAKWMPLSQLPNDVETMRLSGTRAAAARGADVVITLDWALELYIGDTWELGSLASEAPHGKVRAVGAACPSPAAMRISPRGKRSGLPLAHPVVIALDLAQDRARGREMLDAWYPGDVVLVW